jgi:hypothetical protein
LIEGATKNLLFFPEGVKKLVERWNQYMEVERDYVEK